MAFNPEDLDYDLENTVFATDGSGFAREGTFRRVDTGGEITLDLVALELIYSPFDPKNQLKFYIREDQMGGYVPAPNDEVDDDNGTGDTFSILNVLKEENLFSVLAQRMDERQ